MFNGLFTTKTFWVGFATAIGGLTTMLSSGFTLDFSSIGAIVDTVQAFVVSDGWEAVMLGIAIITGRHAVSKIG